MEKKSDWKWALLLILGLVVLPAVIILGITYHKSIMKFLEDFKTEIKDRIKNDKDKLKSNDENTITIDLGGRIGDV